MDFKKMVDDMKSKGVETALVKKDGSLVYATFTLEDPSPSIAHYLANNAQLLMDQLGDGAKEIELHFGDKLLVLIPLGGYLLLGLIKSPEDRKILSSYVESIRSMF